MGALQSCTAMPPPAGGTAARIPRAAARPSGGPGTDALGRSWRSAH